MRSRVGPRAPGFAGSEARSRRFSDGCALSGAVALPAVTRRLSQIRAIRIQKVASAARPSLAEMRRGRRAWNVDFDIDAALDFEDVKSRGDRKAVFNVVQKLKDLGPDLPSPHMKSLKGEANLFELRPKQGACEARPLYARFGDRFVILAVAAKKKDFDRAVMAARDRLKRRS